MKGVEESGLGIGNSPSVGLRWRMKLRRIYKRRRVCGGDVSRFLNDKSFDSFRFELSLLWLTGPAFVHLFLGLFLREPLRSDHIGIEFLCSSVPLRQAFIPCPIPPSSHSFKTLDAGR